MGCRCGEPPKRNCGREDRACIATEDLSTPGSETPSTAVPGAAAHARRSSSVAHADVARSCRVVCFLNTPSPCARAAGAPSDAARSLPQIGRACQGDFRIPTPASQGGDLAATFQVSASARFVVPPYFRASVALFLHPRVVTSPGHIQMFACGNKCARRRGRNRDDRRQGTCFTRPFITLSIKEYRRVAISASVPALNRTLESVLYKF